MRILIGLLCLLLCFGCQATSRQLLETATVPSLTAAPPAQTLQATKLVTDPVRETTEEITTANDCFSSAFDFMDYWSKQDAKTQMRFSVEHGGALKTSLDYSGALLF